MKPRKPKMINVPGYKGPDRRSGIERRTGLEKTGSKPGKGEFRRYYKPANMPEGYASAGIFGRDRRSGKDRRKKRQ